MWTRGQNASRQEAKLFKTNTMNRWRQHDISADVRRPRCSKLGHLYNEVGSGVLQNMRSHVEHNIKWSQTTSEHIPSTLSASTVMNVTS